jgi:hypothetical protein
MYGSKSPDMDQAGDIDRGTCQWVSPGSNVGPAADREREEMVTERCERVARWMMDLMMSGTTNEEPAKDEEGCGLFGRSSLYDEVD